MPIQHTLSKEEIEKVAVVVLTGRGGTLDTPMEGFPENCLYILLWPGETMEFLSETDMAELGWVRKE